MFMGKLPRFLSLFFVVACLSGCAHPSQVGITSTKLNAYNANIKRLLVVTELGEVLKHRSDNAEATFESTFTDALGKCGIVTEIHQHDPLALQNEEQLAVKTFSPDTVMTLVWKSAKTYAGIPTSTVIIGSLLDFNTKRQVWKAEINFAPAYYAGETLASSIVNQLKLQAILGPSCPTPVVPKV